MEVVIFTAHARQSIEVRFIRALGFSASSPERRGSLSYADDEWWEYVYGVGWRRRVGHPRAFGRRGYP